MNSIQRRENRQHTSRKGGLAQRKAKGPARTQKPPLGPNAPTRTNANKWAQTQATHRHTRRRGRHHDASRQSSRHRSRRKLNRERARTTAHDANDNDAAALREHTRSNDDRTTSATLPQSSHSVGLSSNWLSNSGVSRLHIPHSRQTPPGLYAHTKRPRKQVGANSGRAPSYSTKGAPSRRNRRSDRHRSWRAIFSS